MQTTKKVKILTKYAVRTKRPIIAKHRAWGLKVHLSKSLYDYFPFPLASLAEQNKDKRPRVQGRQLVKMLMKARSSEV